MLNKAMILGLVRHGFTVAGGYLVAKGHLDAANVDAVVGAILTITGAGWSITSKKA